MRPIDRGKRLFPESCLRYRCVPMETRICPAGMLFLPGAPTLSNLSRPKTTVQAFRIAPPPHVKCIWPRPPDGLNNPCLSFSFIFLLLISQSRNMQTAFLFTFIFPPPAAGTEVLPRSHCTRAGSATDTGKPFIV